MTRRRVAWIALLAVLCVVLAAWQRQGIGSPATPVRLPPGLSTATATAVPAATMPVRRVHRPVQHMIAPITSRTGMDKLSGMGVLPVVGPPSVSPGVIDGVLAREGSPLAGLGQAIDTQGRRAGIDPAILLAFVTAIDTPSPLPPRLHNVGHIHAVGAQPTFQGYRVFPSWQAGIAAWYGLIRGLYVERWHLRTLDSIVPVYAPGARRDVERRLDAMRAMIAAWRAQSQTGG